MSIGTSNFPVRAAQMLCASESRNRKVDPIVNDGLIEAKWLDDKYNAESSRPMCKIEKCKRNRVNSDFDCCRRSGSVCQYILNLVHHPIYRIKLQFFYFAIQFLCY